MQGNPFEGRRPCEGREATSIQAINRTIIFLVPALLVLAPAAADFNDDQYHEVVLFHWDATSLDVLIVPPAAVATTARLAAVEDSIDAWSAGIRELGAPWLSDGLVITPYVLGNDTPPEVLADPEIVVLSGEANPFVLFGIGAPFDYLVCDTLDLFIDFFTASRLALPGAAPTAPPPGWHQHAGSPWAVMATPCGDGTENVCLVVNTNFALRNDGQHWMYDLNAHEFGHCLGIGHVGDAEDFEAKTYPTEDIMSYQYTAGQVHCVSNLNLRALEGAFAKVFGRPASEQVAPFDYVHMDPSDYEQVACSLGS